MPVQLERLCRMHARVLATVHDQQRRLCILDPVDRATLKVLLPVIPHPLARVYVVQFLRDVARAPLRDVVADAYEHHAGGETLTVAGAHPRRGISPVRTAGNATAVTSGNTPRDEVIHSVDHVIKLGSGQIGLAAHGELDTAPGER